MNIQSAAIAVAKRYSKEHTVKGGYKVELTLENDEGRGWELWETSWPEYENSIEVPETWQRLVNLKMRVQLGLRDSVHGLALAYYFDVMREVERLNK